MNATEHSDDASAPFEAGSNNFDVGLQPLVSIALSLKRIADCLEAPPTGANISALLWEISQRMVRS